MAGPVDVYFGALLPSEAALRLGCANADPIAFVSEGLRIVQTCRSGPPQDFLPLVRNVLLPPQFPAALVPDFFTFVWPPDALPGPYAVFLVIARAGALADGQIDPSDVLATAGAGLTFVP
jgi:hypothetical protein